MSRDRETQRQQALLRTLLGDAEARTLQPWLQPTPRSARGLQAYRAAAGALAERALAAAYPTLQQLIGEASFAGLARTFWQRHPPTDGDIARWGAELARFIAHSETLADEPYLADLARLEWALHEAGTAADTDAPQGLQRLADEDPAALTLQLVPGTALIVSRHPIVTIWQCHRSVAPERFEAARHALAAGRRENALITRHGVAPQVRGVGDAEARFTAAVLKAHSLAQALNAAGAEFDFEAWLIMQLQQRGIAAITSYCG